MHSDQNRQARPWDLFNKNINKIQTEIAEQRFSICKECPFITKSTGQCKKCGCFMKEKTKLPHAECPIGKWGKIVVSYSEENSL